MLYLNAHLKSVGQSAAERGVNECMQLAEQSGVVHRQSGKVTKDTATHATVGAAAGLAVGAVRGNVGRSAAAGAASAARGMLKSGEPDAVYKKFVNRCLKERSYEPIGWKSQDRRTSFIILREPHCCPKSVPGRRAVP